MGDQIAPGSVWVEGRPVKAHRECALRAVLGGIGHLEDHALWCLERDDPDAGLTYRQSALRVDAWVAQRGVESA